MQNDDILKRIQAETPYLADAGFSDQVLKALPHPRRYRQSVIGISWVLALVLGLGLWVSGGPSAHVISWQPALFLSAATLGFWAIMGLFAFIAKEEGILDI